MNTMFNARVLLVDDEVAFLSGLVHHLVMVGLEVCTLTRTKEAVESFREQNIDVIIIDLAMPGFDGLETLRRIKTAQPEAEVIILLGLKAVGCETEYVNPGIKDLLENLIFLKSLPKQIDEYQEKRIIILQKQSLKEVGDILQRVWL